MRTTPFLVPLAALALVTSAAAQSAYEVGRPLLALRLPTVEGDRTIDLAAYRGKRLLLIEFASW